MSGIQLAALWNRTGEILSQAQAVATVRAYRSDWHDFEGWCRARSLDAMPADVSTVLLYLTDLSGRVKVSTLNRRLATISRAHQAAGHESPSHRSAVRLFMRGLRREKGSEPSAKQPILIPHLQAMLRAVPATLTGARDRALLLIGFLGAFRRSELIGLNVADVEITPDGLVIHLHRSKTDPEGKGTRKGIPGTEAAGAFKEWIEAAGIREGPLFRAVNRHGQLMANRLSTESVALVVKRYAAAAGLDPARLAGHSLRAGLATSAAMAGKSERAIMRQTGHRSVTTVRRYIRDGSLFRDNAASGLGL